MPIALEVGRRTWEVDIAAERLLGVYRGPKPRADLTAHVRQALEAPVGFPPLRRALTPEDRVAIVLDARVLHPERVLVPILDHILQMEVSPAAITLLCAASGLSDEWLADLPERLEDVHVEEHDPKDRQKLAYLATTKGGRRLYLNRTLIDADQVVVVSTRRYDLILGHAGAEGSLYPGLSDEATYKELLSQWRTEVPGDEPWPARGEAIEVAWLLGQPFYVQLIPSAGDGIAHVVPGAGEAARAAHRLLDACWKPQLPHRPDCVVVPLSGDPARQTFADLASAAATAARVVRPGGRIILLSEAAADLSPGMEVVLHADGPEEAVQKLHNAGQPSFVAAWQWARAVGHARVSLLSQLPGQTVEDLFASPLEDVAQVQRLVSAASECAVLQDGHRMMAVVS